MSLFRWLTLLLLIVPVQAGTLRITPKDDPTRIEVTASLSKEIAAALPAGKVPQEDGEKYLQLSLVQNDKTGPAMLGSYERDGQKLVFVPRFPLQHEKTYRATLLRGTEVIEAVTHQVPARPDAPAAEVVAFWPTNDILPANQLRFYIQFSRPMRGGSEIFDHIHILDANGKEIADPWLRDELWNEDGTLLTLYIHPGRIKWGVLLRVLLGPVLMPDRAYTFVVDTGMLDVDERKLAKEYRKAFRTSAEDRNRLELSTWKVQAPHASQRDVVSITFPKTLDHFGLERYLKVVDGQNETVKGKVETSRDGREWKFTPESAWKAQDYKIIVDPRLEDVAGNTPVQPFDVEAGAPLPPPQRLSITFTPRQ
jgi:hypothetical protein